MKKTLMVCLLVLGLSIYGYAQVSQEVENFIVKKLSIKDFSFSHKTEISVDLITFSDSELTLRYLLKERPFSPRNLSKLYTLFTSQLNESDAFIFELGRGYDLYGRWNYEKQPSNQEIKTKIIEDYKKYDQLVLHKHNETDTFSTEEAKRDFLARMEKMSFTVEKITVEKLVFKIGPSFPRPKRGFRLEEVHVYSLEGKPITYDVSGLFVD